MPEDPGPTFNGRPATGTLSNFEPENAVLGPNETATFTAAYVLAEDDLVDTLGVPGGIANTATASGRVGIATFPPTSQQCFCLFPQQQGI